MYLQAPLIKPADYKDFIQYALCWYEVLGGILTLDPCFQSYELKPNPAHHHSEEEHLFPQIEALTGEKGIMDQNIEQHR